MMDMSKVLNELGEIAELSPKLRGWLNSKTKSGTRVGLRWAALMQDLDEIHFENVCFEYSHAEKHLPDSPEDLMLAIIEETKDRAHKEREKLEQYEKYHRPRAGEVWTEATKGKVGHIAVELGGRVKAGTLSKNDNDCMLAELLEWAFRAGPQPEWMEDE